ncbi:Uncharacterised protein [Chromobacterium vaccinii]|nr:Uncharacterised protein [Chromobacterium vaccinii]
MSNGEDVFKGLLGRFRHGRAAGDTASGPAAAKASAAAWGAEPEPAVSEAAWRTREAAEEAQDDERQLLTPLPATPPSVKRANGLSEERRALLHRLALEVRGESAGSAEVFDMGYRDPLVQLASPPGAPASPKEGRQDLPVPLWARRTVERGLLGRDARQVFQNLDALGLVNDDCHAAQAAAHWPVEVCCQSFDEMAKIPLSARSELPQATRRSDQLGRDGYFYLKGAAMGTRALIVVDGARDDAVRRVTEIHAELDAAGQSCRVLLLASYAYRWAARRFLWEEIVAEPDIAYAADIADATRAYAAPMADGKRLFLLETSFGMEAVAVLEPGPAARFLEMWGSVPELGDPGVWAAECRREGGGRNKPAALSAFGLEDRGAIARLVAELRRTGAIVFVAGEMARAAAAALMAELWRQGVRVAEKPAAGLPTVLIDPSPSQLRAGFSPVLAVYPGKNATAESVLMALLAEQHDWARGRLMLGVHAIRVPTLCPLCCEPVGAEQAALALAERVSNFRSVDFGNIRTRNAKTPCCGNGYAGEAWFSEVWDGRLLQRELADMPAELADKGLRPDLRISAQLLQAIMSGRVDYLAAGSVGC